MKFIFNKILIILLFTVCSTFCLKGQDDYARHSEIMLQVGNLAKDKKIDEALSLMNKNKDLFQYDALTQFWYNWFNGVILYQTDRYSEARPFIADAISFLDANQNELSDPAIINFLQIYYFNPLISYKLGLNSDQIIDELKRAQYVYELVGATDDPTYSKIVYDLETLNDAVVMTEALNKLASRDFVSAIPLIQKHINFLISDPNSELLDQVLWFKNLAWSYMELGDYQNSEKIYTACIEKMENNSLTNELCYRQVLDAIGLLYVYIHNFEKANEYNSKAKSLYEKALDFSGNYIRCINNSAIIHHGLGHNSTARMMLNVSLREAKKMLIDSVRINSTASLYQFEKQTEKSSSLKDNVYIGQSIVPYITILSNSAIIYSDLGYFPDAIRAIKESIKFVENYGLKMAMPYHNLGTLYLKQSKFPQSVEWFLKSYELCKTPYESDEIGMNTALGLYLSNDSTASTFCSAVSEKMRNNIQDMFAFMSGEERAIYWKHFENYLPVLNLIIYESGNTDAFGTIYDNILEAKGLLLRSTNAIRDAVLSSGNETDIADYIRIGQLKQQLLNEKDNETRESIEKEIETIDKRLTQRVNAYADFTSSKNIHWEEVRDALSKDDVAIEFYNIPLVWGLDSIQTMDGEPRYCAVLLRKGYKYPHIIPLCKESQLEDLDKEDLYETDSIYNLIWQPLENELKGVKNIYFAADRELHKIGIEYAPISEKENIGDRYNLFRLSSTRVLAENKTKSKKESAVLYGGLKYDLDKDELIAESRSGDYHPTSSSRAFSADNVRYGVKYLPGTLKEVEEISQNFISTPRLITDISGTEESFKSLVGSSTDIIHLATHGFFWDENDAQKRDYVTFLNPSNRSSQSNEDKALMRSGLFFSGANIGLRGESLPDDVEDGVLTALELSNMNLGNVDMVVMSACESGLGETSGEGVFGLQRGFKLAGANTLLMSLWKVDDTATKILMTEFYKNYLSGKSKQHSLQLAQQSLRNNAKYSDPEYWAAFILLDGNN